MASKRTRRRTDEMQQNPMLIRRSPRLSSRLSRNQTNQTTTTSSHPLRYAVSSRASLNSYNKRMYSRSSTPDTILNESGQSVPPSFEDEDFETPPGRTADSGLGSADSCQRGGILHHLYGLDVDENGRSNNNPQSEPTRLWNVYDKERVVVTTTPPPHYPPVPSEDRGFLAQVGDIVSFLLFKFGSFLYLTATAVLCLDVTLLHRLFKFASTTRSVIRFFFLVLALCTLVGFLLGGKLIPPSPTGTLPVNISDATTIESLRLSIKSMTSEIERDLKAFEARYKREMENFVKSHIDQVVGHSEFKIKEEILSETEQRYQSLFQIFQDRLLPKINATVERRISELESSTDARFARLPGELELAKKQWLSELDEDQGAGFVDTISGLRKEFGNLLKNVKAENDQELVNIKNAQNQWTETTKGKMDEIFDELEATSNNMSSLLLLMQRHSDRISSMEEKRRLMQEDIRKSILTRLNVLEAASNASLQENMVIDIIREELEKATLENNGPLRQWLNIMYPSKSDVQAFNKHVDDLKTLNTGQSDGGLSRQAVEEMIAGALNLYSADKIGKFDFALEHSGGSVLLDHCSRSYDHALTSVSFFGVLPLWHIPSTPKVIIQPGMHPGNCWAMKGSSGFATVKLRDEVVITGVTVDHIPQELSPNGTIDSAPREFSVHALTTLDGESTKLGNFTYKLNSTSIQQFLIEESLQNKAYNFVRFDFVSNHGNEEYTCVYRVRIHGHYQ